MLSKTRDCVKQSEWRDMIHVATPFSWDKGCDHGNIHVYII